MSDNTGQRVLSVSARNVPTEFEVFYTVAYGLDDGTDVLLAPQTQTRRAPTCGMKRSCSVKSVKPRCIREALVDDLVRLVMIQLSGI